MTCAGVREAAAAGNFSPPIRGPEPTADEIREDAGKVLAILAEVRPRIEELDVIHRRACAKLSWAGRRGDPDIAQWADTLQVACTLHSALAQLRFTAEDMVRYCPRDGRSS